MKSSQRLGSDVPTRYVDVSRTYLQKTFFSNFEFDSVNELLAAVAGMQIDLDTIAQSHDLRIGVYSGWVYWLLYLKGYLQYTESRTVGKGNIYFDYMTTYYGPRTHDPGLSRVLADYERTAERIVWRFQDTEFFRRNATNNSCWVDKVAPIKVMISDQPSKNRLLVYEVGVDIPLKVRLIDGWHRLFSAKLWDIQKLRYEVDREYIS